MEPSVSYVYILTNVHNNVLYTGVTNNLERRCFENKKKLVKGFTQKYNVNQVVYYEVFDNIVDAISREKKIKGFVREKKTKMISEFNPEWKELVPPKFI